VQQPRTPAWRAAPPVAAALAAILYAVVLAPGAAGYDAAWSVLWGSQITSGEGPTVDARFAPTPHPLSLAWSVLVAPLGDPALDVVLALAIIAFGVLVACCLIAGTRMAGPAAGALFALLVATRPALLLETGQALVDIPFLALLAAAAALEAARPRRGLPVLVLVALAGLLRPEAWPIGLAYAAWLWPGSGRRERWRAVAIALAPAVIWALTDLALTGDPTWSLGQTHDLAELLERRRGLGEAFELLPDGLANIARAPVARAGLLGLTVGILWHFRSSVGAAAIGGAGLLAFLFLGAWQLPLLPRYLVVPALILVYFVALGTVGWLRLPRGRERTLATLAGAVCALLLVQSIPGTVDATRAVVTQLDARPAALDSMHRLLDTAAARASLARCGAVRADYRLLPFIALWLDRDPDTISTGARPPGRGVTILRADSVAAEKAPVPPVAGDGGWVLFVRPC
jgi:hypothetical protein